MISVIIPIFNEKDNIPILVNKLIASLQKLQKDYEVILINDGSNDGSKEVLNAAVENKNQCKVVHFKKNFGQTAAMMAGIDFAQGDIVVPMDGDLQNDPEDIPTLLKKLDEGYDVCSGWRKDRKDNRLMRNLPSKIANKIISRASGLQLHDYGCSLKAYKKEVIKDVKLYGEMHRFIPIYASWYGARVTEVPVTHHPRIHGESKYGIIRTFKVILDLIYIKYHDKYHQKPIHFFGGFGLINFFLAFLTLLTMVYYKYFGSKTFVDTPMPVLFVLFMVIGFMSIFFGIIAEMLNRTYYESQGKKSYLIAETINIQEK